MGDRTISEKLSKERVSGGSRCLTGLNIAKKSSALML